ncbi:MAG: hypothetical protein ACLURW_04890, partial [Flavonifractor plautii]
HLQTMSLCLFAKLILPDRLPHGPSALSILISKGGGRLWRPEPKKKDMTARPCPSFCLVLPKKMLTAAK